MSQNYDDIQAQLAAYIDGDLPSGQRAEIEKYLASNPSHQALLGELAAHKRVLRGLPRVKAPADLSEELLNQLEREQLLADPEPAQDRPVIFRLFGGAGLAVAASVLLMLGLVVAVYHILPGRPPVAVVAPSPEETRALKSALPYIPGIEDAIVSPSRKDVAAPGMVPPVVANVIANGALRAQDARELETLSLTPSAQNVEQVVFAVAAPDVDQANGQVLKFLADNDIAWSVGAEAEVQNFRSRSYPLVASLSESARIQEYSRAIAEELKSAGQTESTTAGGFGGGRGGGGGVARGLTMAKAARPAPDAGSDAAAVQPTTRPDTSSVLAFGGARRALKGEVLASGAQQKDLAEAKEKDGPFRGYTNTLAQADSRTILARGLNASQVEKLAMVLDGPVHAQSSLAGQALSDDEGVVALREIRQRGAAAPADPARNEKVDEKPLADALVKADHDKPVAALDGVSPKQGSSAGTMMLPAAKPAAAIAPATRPEFQLSPVVTANQALDAADRNKFKQQTNQSEQRGVVQDMTAQQNAQALVVPPTTRPADRDLYDVLIVLSSAPAAAAPVNAPAPAAAGPAPSTAPASRPMPDAKHE